jgi:AcrR family transcriptional regulator
MFSERQQQIIEESISLIDRKGIQGFTIKNLSREVGISEPAIYRHFESKFDILRAILDSFELRVSENRKIFRENPKDPVVMLKMFSEMVFRILEENPALITVIFSEEIFLNENKLSEQVNKIQKMNEEVIMSVLSELHQNSKLPPDFDMDSFILMYFGSIRLLARKWKTSNYSFSLKERGNKLMLSLLKYLN